MQNKSEHNSFANKTDERAAYEGSLYRRFTRLAVLLTAIMALLYIAWNVSTQYSVVEETVLIEARTMSEQMRATWSYVDQIQDTINRSDDGSYSFKGIYCAAAAKQIASEVTDGDSGYSIRYIRTNPRNVDDLPDDFEKQALESFDDIGKDEYYGVSSNEENSVFRYVSRLNIGSNCLECHGLPAGTRDPTNGFREGMKEGDLAGAISIAIPLDTYRQVAAERVFSTLAFFGLLLLAFIFFIRRALASWVIGPMRKTNQALEKANAAKSEFLTFISHELRTPLSSIIAFTEAWEQSDENRNAEEKNLVREIKDSSMLLSGMVDNLIDSAKVEAGKYHLTLEPVDILDVVDVVKSTIDPLAKSRRISLRVSYNCDIPVITADWEALRTIITNLLGNAVKFTDDDGSVSIDCSYDVEKHISLIQIKDTGCGISPDALKSIFNRFEQDKTFRKEPGQYCPHGSGLGLSLSKELANMMGGEIIVESEQGVGSVFTLILPANTSHEEVIGGDVA